MTAAATKEDLLTTVESECVTNKCLQSLLVLFDAPIDWSTFFLFLQLIFFKLQSCIFGCNMQ